MSYEKQNWKTGDVITSAKLNHLEDGVSNASGVMVVNATKTDNVTTFDKTWQEIYDAMFAGTIVALKVIRGENDIYCRQITSAYIDGEYYMVSINGMDNYEASSADGYPSTED